MELGSIAPWAALIAALIFFLWLDLHFFARGREPSFKEAAWWSVGWLALSLLAAIPVLVLEGAEDAVTYTTVYLIERSLSLDNLFVFLLLFAYFGVPVRAPAAAALLRDRRRARPARRLHPRRHGAARAHPRPDLRARRPADRAGVPDLARCGGERRSGQEPDGAPRPEGLSGDRRVPRGPLVREEGRPALRHADLPLPGGDRVRGHRVRDRLDPGRLRDHARPAADLDGQRVRAARPARAVRARGEPDRALPLPRRDDRDRARPRGREAADRGPGEGRAGGEPRGDRGGVHDRHPAVGARRPEATRTPTRSGPSERSRCTSRTRDAASERPANPSRPRRGDVMRTG